MGRASSDRRLWQRGREWLGAILGMEGPNGRITVTIPNYLTLIRLLIVPLFWYWFFGGRWSLEVTATLLFAFGAITDLWDGKLARRLGQVTPFGDFMDPLADKVLVLSGYWAILLREEIGVAEVLAYIWVVLITLREIAITLLRIWTIGDGTSMVTSTWGKWKTAIQLTTLLFALVAFNVRDGLTAHNVWLPLQNWLHSEMFWGLINVLFFLSASSSLLSGALYLRDCLFVNKKRISNHPQRG